MLLRYGRSAWRSGQGCFSAKTEPRASQRCVHCLRGPSGETWILRGGLPLPEAGLGRGEIVSLEWTEPWLNRTHQAFAALCWWGLPAEIRSLGGTPNYGPRQACSASVAGAPSSVAPSVITSPDCFITLEIGAVSVVSASYPSRVTLAVERTLAIRCWIACSSYEC
jgi:hypothetical protein